jgi:hypothetical protein
MGYSLIYVFNSDGSLDGGVIGATSQIGTWSASGNQLCWNLDTGGVGGTDAGETCFTATLDGNELILSIQGTPAMTLTKI